MRPATNIRARWTKLVRFFGAFIVIGVEARSGVPACRKCGAPAQKYGGIGGYSVQCEACNNAANIKKRAASAKRRAAP